MGADRLKTLFFKFIFNQKMKSVSRDGDSFVYWRENVTADDNLELTPQGLLDLVRYFDGTMLTGEVSIYSLGIISFPVIHLIKIDLFTREVFVVVDKDAEIPKNIKNLIDEAFLESGFYVTVKNSWNWKGYLL